MYSFKKREIEMSKCQNRLSDYIINCSDKLYVSKMSKVCTFPNVAGSYSHASDQNKKSRMTSHWTDIPLSYSTKSYTAPALMHTMLKVQFSSKKYILTKLQRHTVRNLHFLSKISTLISRENCRFVLGEKLVKMLRFWTF